MTQWKVPPDTSQKEKIVGGVLTAVQLLWMILGLGIAAGLALLLGSSGMGIVGVVIGLIIGLAFGCFFSFFKKEGLPIFTYFRLNVKHKRKIHYLLHRESIGTKKEYYGGGF